MYTVKTYKELDVLDKDRFLSFINQISTHKDNASTNMFSRNKNGLIYILENTNRFSSNQGEFHIIFLDEKIVGCGGVYKSNFSSQISLGGVRTWVDPAFRNKGIIGSHLLPIHKEWAIINNCKIIALSFNEYNKNLISIFKRIRLGETKNRIKNRSNKSLFYSNFNEVDFPVTIQYTPQWVIYEKLDETFEFDWATIKCK